MSLVEMLVVAVGFDKSDSDFVGSWRPCNRQGGNSSLFVQQFACLEGPVAENYENEVKTIGNPEYPIQSMIQSLADDRLHTIVITASSGGEVKNCACFVFMPVPFLRPRVLSTKFPSLAGRFLSTSLKSAGAAATMVKVAT